MSRRTKLLITALFLVLLSIPIAYVILTWATPNPLRFHIVAYHPPGSPDAWEDYGKLDLRVQNTSHIPVQLFLPSFERADVPALAHMDPFSNTGSTARGPGLTELRVIVPPGMTTTFMLIPPGGSAPFPCRVILGDETLPFTWENAEVRYQWTSDIRIKYEGIWGWLAERLTERVMAHLPYPNFLTDTTELTPAGP